MATCRDKPEPFALVHDESLLLDWDQALTPRFEKTPKQKGNTFRIQQLVVLLLYPRTTVLRYLSLISSCTPILQVLSFQPVPPKQLKKSKIKDIITDLLPYLSEENRGFYHNIIDTQLPTVSRRPTEAENSDADFHFDEDDVMEED
ncbi:hypothetical protein PR048_031819 [Dryococelus australis]|uniref:Uncharacterized protein n=1 Tax=Dryococelus australis TaxID=614101 RepID=A0ABQ9G6C5_9NEOP|nr:hypothetical protein PR048_031819 [Dryococelus australis]